MLRDYIKSLKETYDTRDYLEHSYRTQLETLLKSYIESRNLPLTVIHEPVRDVFGAPDFKIIDRAALNTSKMMMLVQIRLKTFLLS